MRNSDFCNNPGPAHEAKGALKIIELLVSGNDRGELDAALRGVISEEK